MPNKAVLSLTAFAANSGITRLIPSICNNSAAIKYGSLTDGGKEIYRAIFYRRTATSTMLRELDLTEYISRVSGSQQVLLDCGHYVHDYEYETIASQSKDFLKNIIQGERAN